MVAAILTEMTEDYTQSVAWSPKSFSNSLAPREMTSSHLCQSIIFLA